MSGCIAPTESASTPFAGGSSSTIGDVLTPRWEATRRSAGCEQRQWELHLGLQSPDLPGVEFARILIHGDELVIDGFQLERCGRKDLGWTRGFLDRGTHRHLRGLLRGVGWSFEPCGDVVGGRGKDVRNSVNGLGEIIDRGPERGNRLVENPLELVAVAGATAHVFHGSIDLSECLLHRPSDDGHPRFQPLQPPGDCQAPLGGRKVVPKVDHGRRTEGCRRGLVRFVYSPASEAKPPEKPTPRWGRWPFGGLLHVFSLS